MTKKYTNWTCIYKTNNRFEAEAIKGNLESSDVPCVLMNKQDSSYLAFGYIEVNVPTEFEGSARFILDNQSTQN